MGVDDQRLNASLNTDLRSVRMLAGWKKEESTMGDHITGHPCSLEEKDVRPGAASTAPNTAETSTPVIMGHGYTCKKLLLDHQDNMGTTLDETRPHGDKTSNSRGHLEGGPFGRPGSPSPPCRRRMERQSA